MLRSRDLADATPPHDEIDLRIVRLLLEDGRRSVADIAGHVPLSPTAVKRRIERLERTGIIAGYSARIDYERLGWGVAAFTELRYTGTTTPDEMHRLAASHQEISAVYTTAGAQDVIALVHATGLDHLRDVIHRLRATPGIIGTRTHVILDTHVKNDWHPERV
jgi:DNA-binding Lrp family transcriptional regulator